MNSKSMMINNEYDYSNVLPTVEAVSYLVQYCDMIYKQFAAIVDEDEKRNEKIKYDFRNYNYKKAFSNKLEIYVSEKNLINYITCKDFNEFKNLVEAGNINGLSKLEIRLCMDYKRGNDSNLENYDNSFIISFKPYEIYFIRKSNHSEEYMNNIEENIKSILNKFPIANSIFYTK